LIELPLFKDYGHRHIFPKMHFSGGSIIFTQVMLITYARLQLTRSLKYVMYLSLIRSSRF